MQIETLKIGSKGPFVQQWEIFLVGLGLLADKEVDTEYTSTTAKATEAFQSRYGLYSDGVAGNKTVGYAMAQLDFEVLPLSSEDYPSKPAAAKPLNFAGRQKLLGAIEFAPAPTSGNPECVKITNGWAKENLSTVNIPQLKGVHGASRSGNVTFNKAACKQLQGLFKAWEDEGHAKKILGWGGSYAPRFIRGSRSVLSNHAHASAFDINVPWNGLNRRPALIGQQGSVRELVLTAYRFGFFWGGWFTRKDGMHFEVCHLE